MFRLTCGFICCVAQASCAVPSAGTEPTEVGEQRAPLGPIGDLYARGGIAIHPSVAEERWPGYNVWYQGLQEEIARWDAPSRIWYHDPVLTKAGDLRASKAVLKATTLNANARQQVMDLVGAPLVEAVEDLIRDPKAYMDFLVAVRLAAEERAAAAGVHTIDLSSPRISPSVTAEAESIFRELARFHGWGEIGRLPAMSNPPKLPRAEFFQKYGFRGLWLDEPAGVRFEGDTRADTQGVWSHVLQKLHLSNRVGELFGDPKYFRQALRPLVEYESWQPHNWAWHGWTQVLEVIPELHEPRTFNSLADMTLLNHRVVGLR